MGEGKRGNSLFKVSWIQGECICLKKETGDTYSELDSPIDVYNNSCLNLDALEKQSWQTVLQTLYISSVHLAKGLGSLFFTLSYQNCWSYLSITYILKKIKDQTDRLKLIQPYSLRVI